MDRNPYTPPAAPVGDIPQGVAIARPRAVTIAVVLLALNILAGIWYDVSYAWQVGFAEVRLTSWIMMSFNLLFWGWLYYKIFMGRNWARIVTLVLLGGSLALQVFRFTASAPAGVKMSVDTSALIPFGIHLCVPIIALLLLFIPGREWFHRR